MTARFQHAATAILALHALALTKPTCTFVQLFLQGRSSNAVLLTAWSHWHAGSNWLDPFRTHAQHEHRLIRSELDQHTVVVWIDPVYIVLWASVNVDSNRDRSRWVWFGRNLGVMYARVNIH